MADFFDDQFVASDTRGPTGALFAFDNTYARLPERFYARLPPTPVAAPRLVRVNESLARLLGVDPARLAAPDGVEALAGNRVPDGAEPLAMAYAGHQFGGFSPQLGDGRALLLGEVVGVDGVRRDIQLKGSGPTPFSRMGDGRAVLGPVLREYILGEAMHALGIPTTRALAAVTTGERVLREGFLPGAVLTRVAESHVRIGTFEYFRNRGDTEAVRLLADYVIGRHYPDLAGVEQKYRALLDAVIERTAKLVAQWLMVGFIHGVMNTDNMSIAGETIDYGPCAFMDFFHPGTVYSSIDHGGRYAFGNQPRIAHWNLARLAECLLPLLAGEPEAALADAKEALSAFPKTFDPAYLAGLRAKLGLFEARDGDLELAHDLLDRMAENQADYTLTFRVLSDSAAAGPEVDEPVRSLFVDPTSFDAWARQWRERLAQESDVSPAARRTAMRTKNPAFIPRNHRVQAVITAAETAFDFGPLDELLAVLARPHEDQPEFGAYAAPPQPDEVVQQTFCGT